MDIHLCNGIQRINKTKLNLSLSMKDKCTRVQADFVFYFRAVRYFKNKGLVIFIHSLRNHITDNHCVTGCGVTTVVRIMLLVNKPCHDFL